MVISSISEIKNKYIYLFKYSLHIISHILRSETNIIF